MKKGEEIRYLQKESQHPMGFLHWWHANAGGSFFGVKIVNRTTYKRENREKACNEGVGGVWLSEPATRMMPYKRRSLRERWSDL